MRHWGDKPASVSLTSICIFFSIDLWSPRQVKPDIDTEQLLQFTYKEETYRRHIFYVYIARYGVYEVI